MRTIIFDIDGTLADIEHRRHLVDGSKKKDFDAFYDEMIADNININVWELYSLYATSGQWCVVICTGRPEKYREVTEYWLKSYKITYDRLLMRPDDRRFDPDYQIKTRMLEDLRKTHDIQIAVDDRDQVVKMWRQHSITCFQVADGDF